MGRGDGIDLSENPVTPLCSWRSSIWCNSKTTGSACHPWCENTANGDILSVERHRPTPPGPGPFRDALPLSPPAGGRPAFCFSPSPPGLLERAAGVRQQAREQPGRVGLRSWRVPAAAPRRLHAGRASRLAWAALDGFHRGPRPVSSGMEAAFREPGPALVRVVHVPTLKAPSGSATHTPLTSRWSHDANRGSRLIAACSTAWAAPGTSLTPSLPGADAGIVSQKARVTSSRGGRLSGV